MAFSLGSTLFALAVAWLGFEVSQLLYNLFLHPLRGFPGPRAAAASAWWKTYKECFRRESQVHLLMKLHKRYGDIIRIGPNELHFANPSAFNEIYNPSLRWDKERVLYGCFGEDHSSFGFLTYAEAKQRKEVLQPLFSRRAILDMQWLVRKNADHLADALAKNDAAGASSDLLFAFRSFANDTITAFAFGRSVDALDAPGFAAPLVRALNASLPTFVYLKHFPPLGRLVRSLPPRTARRLSPETAGLSDLQTLLAQQVRAVLAAPERLREAPHPTIYHRMLDPEAHSKGKGAGTGSPELPGWQSLYEEAQALMFAGTNTVGDALTVGHFGMLSTPGLQMRLREEVRGAWPDLADPPRFEALEKLPLLTATIKESLRLSPGASSPLLRVVPPQGATISGRQIPGGTVVGMATPLVHLSPEIFGEHPERFDPDRRLDKEELGAEGGRGRGGLDAWLVAFSKGPRSCLGSNLAWCELYLVFATLVRRFDMALDGTTEADMAWRDCFTPHFYGRHLHAWCRPLEEGSA